MIIGALSLSQRIGISGAVVETYDYDIYGRLTAAEAWDGDSVETVADGDSSDFIEFGEYAAVSVIDNVILFSRLAGLRS